MSTYKQANIVHKAGVCVKCSTTLFITGGSNCCMKLPLLLLRVCGTGKMFFSNISTPREHLSVGKYCPEVDVSEIQLSALGMQHIHSSDFCMKLPLLLLCVKKSVLWLFFVHGCVR